MGQKNRFKSGFVAIAGVPNVGKSTLINAFANSKVAIVSPKPQTTRFNIKMILTTNDSQIIFVDTPGIHEPKNKLGERMMNDTSKAIKDADVFLLTVGIDLRDFTPREKEFLQIAKKEGIKTILVINKADKSVKGKLLSIIDNYSKEFDFESIIPVSAITGDGIEILHNEIAKLLPEGPKYYPDEYYTDLTERQIVSELIRENVLKFTSKEIPHGTAVEIEKFKEGEYSGKGEEEGGKIVRISAVIYCEKQSHKKILVGKDGSMIKRIGIESRKETERFLNSKVHLELHVKERKDWRNNHMILKNLGFEK